MNCKRKLKERLTESARSKETTGAGSNPMNLLKLAVEVRAI